MGSFLKPLQLLLIIRARSPVSYGSPYTLKKEGAYTYGAPENPKCPKAEYTLDKRVS